MVYIDDVSVTPVDAADAPPPVLGEDLALDVQGGTRLRLDYIGTNRVGTVRLNGQSAVGLIDATHPSGLVLGPGALFVQPSGTVILIR